MRTSFLLAAVLALAMVACAAASDDAFVKGVPSPSSSSSSSSSPTPVAASVSPRALMADDGLKPWDISATKTTISLSWIAFVLLLSAAVMVGSCLGYSCKGGRGDQNGKYLAIDTSAHDLCK